jgi:hypothetical protein
MVKRTKGYILLTLLVITGLASQVPKETLTGKERKLLVTQLKESRTSFLDAIKDLNQSQLAFKPQGRPSINQWIQRQASAEINLWKLADTAVERPHSKNEQLPADGILQNLGDAGQKELDPKAYQQMQGLPADKSVKLFLAARNDVLKYVRTTTDDAHHHIAQTPFGPVTIYQVISTIPANTAFYIHRINETKAQPGFPK